MKIEDIVQLLNNRLREFKLSSDYAKMSGDLERMNAADKEVLSLEDTLYKLNLLVDVSASAAVKEDILAEVITDGSVAVLGEYDITSYATDPLHEEKIMNILSKMGVMDTAEKIDDYIHRKYLSSPVTGEMVMNAASAYGVDARLMMALIEQDSSFGTAGKAVGTLNPGNVGNDDSGNTRTYESWQEGVTAVAGWLSRHRGSTIIPETPDTSTLTPLVATSTPSIVMPTATSTPAAATSTPTAATPLESVPPLTGQASTPEIIIPVITSTTTTTTTISTPTSSATSTPAITSQPEAGPPPAETPETAPVATSQPEAGPPPAETTTTYSATTTPTAATSQPEAGPPPAETTTTSSTTSTPTAATSTPTGSATSTPETSE